MKLCNASVDCRCSVSAAASNSSRQEIDPIGGRISSRWLWKVCQSFFRTVYSSWFGASGPIFSTIGLWSEPSSLSTTGSYIRSMSLTTAVSRMLGASLGPWTRWKLKSPNSICRWRPAGGFRWCCGTCSATASSWSLDHRRWSWVRRLSMWGFLNPCVWGYFCAVSKAVITLYN